MRSFDSYGTSLYWLQIYLRFSSTYILVAGHGNVMFVRVLRRRGKKEAYFSAASRAFPPIFIPSVQAACSGF
jgi:hypothetical protein